MSRLLKPEIALGLIHVGQVANWFGCWAAGLHPTVFSGRSTRQSLSLSTTGAPL